MSTTDSTYDRCAHCGGDGAHWIAWDGRVWAVKDLEREHSGDDALCAVCRRALAVGDPLEPGCAEHYPAARRRADAQKQAETVRV